MKPKEKGKENADVNIHKKKRGPYFKWLLRDKPKIPRSTLFSRAAAAAAATDAPRKPSERKLLKCKSVAHQSKPSSSVVNIADKTSASNILPSEPNVLVDSVNISSAERELDKQVDVLITFPSTDSTQLPDADICLHNNQCEVLSDSNLVYNEEHCNQCLVVGDNPAEYSEHYFNDIDENADLEEDCSIMGVETPCAAGGSVDARDDDNDEDDDDDDDDDDNGDDDDDEDLTFASDIHLTISQKIKLLLQLATKQRHNLSYSAAEDMMKLSGVISDDKEENGFLYNRHIMKKAIELYSACDLTEHHVCPHCGLYIGVNTCSFECGNCHSNFRTTTNKTNGNIFLVLSLKQQLEAILKHCFNDMIDPKKREKICNFNYEDIYDGDMYRVEEADRVLTFNFFVDGLQVATTSKRAAWPVLGCVNELPLLLRRKYVFMACLWLGLKKPNCQEYLKPFVKECCLLARDGIEVKVGCKSFKFDIKPLMCVSDTIARPLLRNSVQFNGKFGCGLCYHPGVRMRYGKGHVRSYSMKQGEYALRTHQEIMEMAVYAENQGSPRYGIKGKSILSEIPGFDMARCLDLDFFHALVNVSKRFASLWFSEKFRRYPFNVYDKFSAVDDRFVKITPTSNVSRAPRSLKDRADFRGHEWFHWVVNYSVPILKNVLPAKYLNHWGELVRAVALLMQNSVTKREVGYAHRYLMNFVGGIDDLYGPQHVTISVHLLTHLNDSVRYFAQPWTHSAFIFENVNHDLKKFVKSSNGIALQICKGIQLRVAIKNLEETVREEMSVSEKAFFQRMTVSEFKYAEPHLVVGETAMLGQPKNLLLTPTIRNLLEKECVACEYGVMAYDRCVFNGELYHSSLYSKVSRQCNCFVQLDNNEVFRIDHFLVIGGDCFVLGVIVKHNDNVKLCNFILPHVMVLNDKPEAEHRCFRTSALQSKLLSYTLDIPNSERVRIACVNVLQNEMLS